MTNTRYGGVIFRTQDALHFLPASIAIKVMPTPEIARVPGAPRELRGVALVDGDMIPVVELCSPTRTARSARHGRGGAMLVCAIHGERLGVVGIEVVATGHFDAEPPDDLRAPLVATGLEATELASLPSVKLESETARAFDVEGLIARVREGRWAV
jgi:chemotaxis signal transduction protein